MQSFTDNTALRSQLQSQVDFMTAFTNKALDTLRQLSELNMNMARQTIDAAIYSSRELFNCKDATQMAQMAMKQLQPANERWRHYQQQLMNVLAGAQADFLQVSQASIPAAVRSASAAADDMVRQAAANAHAASPQADWPADQQPPGVPH